jgi:hypothetical protein
MAHMATGVRRKIRKLGYRARERLYKDGRPSLSSSRSKIRAADTASATL